VAAHAARRGRAMVRVAHDAQGQACVGQKESLGNVEEPTGEGDYA
jgi:hypothetical protein